MKHLPVFFASLSCCGNALAQPEVPAAPAETRMVGRQLSWDNDLWGSGKTDRWYTNGLRLSWTFDQAATDQPVTDFVSGVGAALLGEASLEAGKRPTVTYTIGQTMYTPRNITRSDPQPDDRPWGAFLYTGTTVHSYQQRWFHATELKLGVTGKHAYGGEAQRFVHRNLTRSPRPEGWDQQLGGRIGAQLSHLRIYRFGDNQENDRFGFQLGGGGAAGSLRSYAMVSAAMLVGDLKGTDSPIAIGNEGDLVTQDFNNRDQFKRFHGFVAGAATAVGYSYFLRGKTPYGHANIKPKPYHLTLQWGVSVPLQRWKSWLPRLTYTHTHRTAEFEVRNLPAKDARQNWGTLGFHWDLE
jgi:lipid A 3-O-deacylase